MQSQKTLATSMLDISRASHRLTT
eukprot:SAG11_NODE_34308_length_272_cov_1.502890_1_plen_23_part_10